MVTFLALCFALLTQGLITKGEIVVCPCDVSFQTKIMQRLEDLSKDFKALNSQVTKVDKKTKELSSQDENRYQRIVTLEGSILKAGDAELKMQQTLTKFEDQMDGLAIKIANLASQVDDVSISNTKDKADIQWLQLTVQSLQSLIKSKEGQMNEKINHLEEVTMDNHGYLDNVNSTLQLEVQASTQNGQKIVFMEDKIEEMAVATGKTSVEIESLQANMAALVEGQAGANSSIAANQQNILTLEQDSNNIKTRVSNLECQNRPCKNGAACLSLPEGFKCDCAGTGYKGELCADGCLNGQPCENGGSCVSLIDPTLCLNDTCHNCQDRIEFVTRPDNCQCPSTHFGDLCEFENFCAKLFKGKSFVGESWTAMDGDENSDLGIWDQVISSIMVKPGCTLQGFDFLNFNREAPWTWTYQWTSDDHALRSPYNNDISSWKCFC